jgi:hypothetical protein
MNPVRSADSPSTAVAIPVRVRLRGLPPAASVGRQRIEAGLQRGKEIVQSRPPTGDTLELTGELRLKAADTVARRQAPVFLGPFTHGPPAGRFLYVAWTGEENGIRAMFRRLKLPLGGITWTLIDAALREPGGILAGTVAGRARDGGPACATVPLLDGGWRVER